ncbi:MAG: outer membrane lipoprotein LolB [Lautropia sp.]
MTPALASRLARRCALLLLGGMLAACASTTPAPPIDPAAAARGPLRVDGRFSLSFTEQQPETKTENASGTFELYKDDARLKVDLSGPLGQTIARAEHARGARAVLETNDGRRFEGATLDEVFERAIGIRVPAEKLPDWLADRFQTVLERAPDGSRVRATDSGWQIDRRGSRWHLVWHEGSRRIEVRLVANR